MMIETIVAYFILAFCVLSLGLFFAPYLYLLFAVLFIEPKPQEKETEEITFIEDQQPTTKEQEDEDFEAELDYDIVDLG